jgi:hypothetical protein
MGRILLVTVGSLGDLHPFVAIGRALVAQGRQVLLAVPEDGVAKVRASYDDAVQIDAAGLGLSLDRATFGTPRALAAVSRRLSDRDISRAAELAAGSVAGDRCPPAGSPRWGVRRTATGGSVAGRQVEADGEKVGERAVPAVVGAFVDDALRAAVVLLGAARFAVRDVAAVVAGRTVLAVVARLGCWGGLRFRDGCGRRLGDDRFGEGH